MKSPLKFIFNFVFWPLQKIDPEWGKNKIPKEHKYSVALLCVIYFFQLFIYRFIDSSLFKIDGFEINGQVINKYEVQYSLSLFQFYGTIFGAIFFATRLIIRRHAKNPNSIRSLLIRSNAFLSVTSLVYILLYCSEIRSAGVGFYNLLGWIKFFIGAGNSVFIGLAITWICESIFRHLRTTASIYLGFWGFGGAMIASIFEKFNDKLVFTIDNIASDQSFSWFKLDILGTLILLTPSYLMLGISVLLHCFSNKHKLLEDAKLVEVFYSDKESLRKIVWDSALKYVGELKKETDFRSKWNYLNKWISNLKIIKERTLIIFSLLVGMIVQYWVFVAAHSAELFDKESKGVFFRYAGMFIGSLILLRYKTSLKSRRRDTLLLRSLLGSFLLNIILINFAGQLKYINPCLRDAFFLLTGILSCISWIIGILHVGEQFDIKYRPWMIIIAPNIFRASEMLLQWRTHNIFSSISLQIDKLVKLQTDELVKLQTEELVKAVMSWGAMFSFLGIIAIMVLKKNNYEGDALETEVDKDGKIDEAKVLQEINNTTMDSESIFFETVNEKMSDHLKKVLDLQCYLVSTYYKQDDIIRHSEYSENPKAISCYKLDNEYPTKDIHRISAELVADKKHESFIEKLFNANTKSGGLMYLPGREVRKLMSDDNGFKEFELTTINLREVKLKKDHMKITLGASKSDFEDILDKVADDGKIAKNYPDRTKLHQTFALFRLDAEQYAPETYFLYIIKPISSAPRCALVIKTAIELSEGNLVRLRNLISAVQANWDEKSKEEEYIRVRELQRSALGTHFIKNMVRQFSEYCNEESDYRKRSQTTEKVASLSAAMMSLDKPYISVDEEEKFIKKYLEVYLLMTRFKANSEVKFIIDAFLEERKEPFNWKIDFSIEDNPSIPRGILQPIVENALVKSGFSINEYDKINLEINLYLIKGYGIEVEISNCVKRPEKIKIQEIKDCISGKTSKSNGARTSLCIINNAIKSHNKGLINSSIEPMLIGNKFIIRFSLREYFEDNMMVINKESDLIVDRPDGLGDKKIMVVDDSEFDINKIKECLEYTNQLKEDIVIKSLFMNLESAEKSLMGGKFDILIFDLWIDDEYGKKSRSIDMFKKLAQQIIISETGVIIVSNSDDELRDVDVEMNAILGKNYLGSSKKFEYTSSDFNKFLNKYYLIFKK